LDDLIKDFISETREGLEALDSELVRFEQEPDDPEILGGIFRLIHTIKGTCGFLGLNRLQTVAHAAENVLGAFRDGVLTVTPTAVTAVLDTVDLIRSITDELAAQGSEPEGDDSVLIGRLEAVLNGESGGSTAPAEAAPAAAPADDGKPKDNRKLIEQLGNDATLDAASEIAIGHLQTEESLTPTFGEVDPDRLQAALRDSLSLLARAQAAGDGFANALAEVTGQPLAPEMVSLTFEAVADALHDLDIGDHTITWLRSLALPVEAAAAPVEAPPVAEATAEAAPVEAAKPPAKAPAPAKSVGDAKGGGGDADGGPAQTIRVSVDVLENLMTVVSELVLIRNQLIQTLRQQPDSPFTAPLNRLNQVTSELQEGVMTTRMQPISGAWAKIPRLVRDLSQDLGKSIDLVQIGQETELDRQVLELIKDPLTHMIRNAADHGLETPEERKAAGKSPTGRITLQARHEGGAIVIEVADDGRGLPADKIRAKALSNGLISQTQADTMSDAEVRQLIFLPGLSTAKEVTSVSGRGVGMDVVRTNIEKIGGAIELNSVEGGGTRFTIRIPLTLTIVSALIVECCGDRFAMPQSSIVELVSAGATAGRTIENIDGTQVLRLRDRLLPLVSLQELLKLDPVGEAPPETCIVVARVGSATFGVIVDRVFDTEEIVVKPVSTVLRDVKIYSGATIVGDGSVNLILDLKGIWTDRCAGQAGGAHEEIPQEVSVAKTNVTTMLVFRAANDSLRTTPLATVARIEEVGSAQIERVGNRTVMQYRGKLMPVVNSDAGPAETWEGDKRRPLLVFAKDDYAVGLLVHEIVDIVESTPETGLKSDTEGALGSLIIEGAAAELIDVEYYWREALNDASAPTFVEGAASAGASSGKNGARRLLIIDQSPFSQLLMRPLLAQAGYEVVVAVDPQAALARYEKGEMFDLIMADTNSSDTAQAFAQTFAQAVNWHRIPLLSLGMQAGVAASGASPEASTLLSAVSSALGEMRGAA
jgi:two-component system, chemotaxis family, sensor kinase CheA